jgi:SAM-dependent methyltransferase
MQTSLHPATAHIRAEDTACAVATQTGCALCSGPTGSAVGGLFDTRFGIEGEFGIVRCLRCGFEQLAPLPAPMELKHLYQRFYNFPGERGTGYTVLRDWFFASPLYRMWIRLDGDISFHTRRGRGRLLDVGCNEGRTLKNYARNGFEAEGTELNETAAQVAREAGFAVSTAPLEEFFPASLFDVAVLSNVLEHALDPRQMLGSVERLLKPHGQVWISCPNSQSRFRAWFGKRWIHWHVPFHISHFSSQSLRRLLQENGFQEIEIRQITPALWVASSMVTRLFARPGKPTRQLRNPLLMCGLVLLCRALLFPLLYSANRAGRGDCLVATATRAG